ncbi:MAG: hypothetical protein ACRD0M_09060, partial [Acidimicrobiales bacterium]
MYSLARVAGHRSSFALAAVTLALGGLAVDATVHALDPARSAAEGGLTLASPAHAATVAGLAAAAVILAGGGHGRGRRRVRPGTLTAVVVGGAVLVWST